MSISEVNKRFSKVLLTKNNFESCSLPLVGRKEEVIFLYYTKKVDGYAHFERVTKIISRDLLSSKINVRDIPTDNTAIKQPFLLNNQVSGEDAIKLMVQYYDLHEKVMKLQFSQKLTSEEKKILKDYQICFNQLISNKEMQQIYYKISSDIFDYVEEQFGMPFFEIGGK